MKDYKTLLDRQIIDKVNKIVRSFDKEKYNFTNLNKNQKENAIEKVCQELKMNKEQALWVLDIRNHQKAIKNHLLEMEGISDTCNYYSYIALGNYVKKSQIGYLVISIVFGILGVSLLVFSQLFTEIKNINYFGICFVICAVGMFLSLINNSLIFKRSQIESVNTDKMSIINAKPIAVSFETVNHFASSINTNCVITMNEVFAIVLTFMVDGKKINLYYFTQVFVHDYRYYRSIYGIRKINPKKYIRKALLEEKLRLAYYSTSRYIDFTYGNINEKIDNILVELQKIKAKERSE